MINGSLSKLCGHRVVLFGGSGFVGAHLSRLLRSVGAEVGVVTRAVREPTECGPGLTLLPSSDVIAAAVDRFEPDAVANLLVCYGREGESVGEMVRVNSLAPVEIADCCNSRGVRLVHVDTFSWKPRTGAMMDNAYARTKRLAGELITGMSLGRTSVAIARLEFPYGPGDRAHKLIPSLLRAFASHQPSFDLSDGEQTRDFVWVDDVANALAALFVAELPVGVTEVEVGTGSAVRLRDFAMELREACGAPTELRFGSRPRLPGDMETSYADTDWLRRIGALPTVSFREGCRRLAASLQGPNSA